VLAKLKVLRGTWFDIFGKSAERKTERRLIAEYEATVEALMERLSPETHALAVEIARIPDEIRGFGHIKEASIPPAKAKEAQLMTAWRDPAAARQWAPAQAAE
jgi:indolepyruvate ferredoxin oxidoreductase